MPYKQQFLDMGATGSSITPHILGAMGFSVFPHGFVLFWSDYFHFPVGGGVNVTALLSQFRSMWLSFHLLKDGVLLCFRLA